MKANDILINVKRGLSITGLKFKKHSPEIMVVTGVIGAITAAVMACKATTRVNDILESAKEEIEAVHKVVENPENDYTEEEHRKAVAIVYGRTAWQLIKLYGPSIIIGGLSITSILTGHGITRKRNMALAAAYAGLDKTFKEYRDRIAERFGNELEKEIRYNITAKEVEGTTVDENGEVKTEKAIANVPNIPKYSEYAKVYDDGCAGWTKDPELNKAFLIQQQNWANERLKEIGYLFLNEVYDMLGIPRTAAGQIIGWIYDKDNAVGDNYIDFGIFDPNNERAAAFINGYERTVILDFNVDGNILDML